LFHCFSPDHEGVNGQVGGDVVRFVQLMTGLSPQHLGIWFKETFANLLTSTKPPRVREGRSIASSNEQGSSAGTPRQIPANTSRAHGKPMEKPLAGLEPNHPYLAQRQIPPATIKRYGVGYCRRGVLARHIAMPVYGADQTNGEPPLCYLGRRVDEDKRFPKYKWGAKGFESPRCCTDSARRSRPTSTA
jgi:hypothetical protein